MKAFITIDELCQYLSLKKSFVYTKVESGELPHYRIGRLLRFRREDIDQWMESNRREAVDIGKKARGILRAINKEKVDIDGLVKKKIAELRENRYTLSHGKPDHVEGLGKEVEHGTL